MVGGEDEGEELDLSGAAPRAPVHRPGRRSSRMTDASGDGAGSSGPSRNRSSVDRTSSVASPWTPPLSRRVPSTNRASRRCLTPLARRSGGRAAAPAFRTAANLLVQVDGALHRLVPVAEVQALVLRVRVRVRVLHADEQRRHAAELPRERLDERDRPAAADGHRRPSRSPSSARGTPPGTPGATSPCTTSPPRRSGLHVDLDAPRRRLLQRARPAGAARPSGPGRAPARMPTRAHADSQMMLRASFRLLAWMAFTAIDGCRQFISHGCAPPPSSSTPGQHARLLAEVRLVARQRLRCSAARPR